MKIRGPILTLAAGAVIAVVLLVLNLVSAPAPASSVGDDPGPSSASRPDAGVTTPAQVAPTTAAPASAGPVGAAPGGAAPGSAAPGSAAYAGKVSGGGGSVAIVVHGPTAVAYFCDGKKAEAWLQGSVAHGSMRLAGGSGAAPASLTASYTAQGAQGTVTVGGRQWSFVVSIAKPPSGLYRATASVRAAQVIGGWIVLADGTQVGVVSVGGAENTAPPLDTGTLTTTVDGTAVTAHAVTGPEL